MKKKSPKKPTAIAISIPEIAPRAGLPSRDSIVGLTPETPARYRIILTNEIDEYERGAASPAAFAVAAAAMPTGDKFKGSDRKAAKLSISKAAKETFGDLKDLIPTLNPESQMKSHVPAIGTGSTSKRVAEEERNVRVKAFIYAASRESDNDFHLIIGRAPNLTPEIYMTMELSGLPASSAGSFKKLKTVRDAFKKFYSEKVGNLPGMTYDFPDPPIPVEIQGSLFFDMSHVTGTRPGPKSLKSRMPVIWEVHPITKIVFEP